MPENIVIIGAGQAGAQAVQSLRAEGFAGPITLVGDEAYPPYQRPPLSKAYLLGTFERPRLFLKADAYYAESRCELLLDTSAKAIHRADRTVELTDGRKLAYDKLLLATGARVRKLRCPGADLPGIHYLKTIADVDGLQAANSTSLSASHNRCNPICSTIANHCRSNTRDSNLPVQALRIRNPLKDEALLVYSTLEISLPLSS